MKIINFSTKLNALTTFVYAALIVSGASFGVKGSPNSRFLSSRLRGPITSSGVSISSRKTEEGPNSNLRTQDIDLIRFVVTDGIESDETLVYFIDGGTDTFDPDYDARKISTGGLNVSTHCYKVGFDMAINGISNTLPTLIPIKVVANNTNICKLEIPEYVNTTNRKLYVYDLTLNTYTLIEEGKSINLGGNLNKCLGRFFLTSIITNIVTGISSAPVTKSNSAISPNPYNSGQLKITISGQDQGMADIEIADLKGDILKDFSQSGTISGSYTEFDIERQVFDLPGGSYIIKVKGKSYFAQQKLMISK
ncbi:MAG: hypothetical protein H7329_15110 [Opitutaceae bacterium]|nr:hypothetical protein [Cytophagales bacterium]